jgi:hypothetical protein
MRPWLQTAKPGTPWPPPRTDTKRLLSRANLTAFITSATPAQRTIRGRASVDHPVMDLAGFFVCLALIEQLTAQACLERPDGALPEHGARTVRRSHLQRWHGSSPYIQSVRPPRHSSPLRTTGCFIRGDGLEGHREGEEPLPAPPNATAKHARVPLRDETHPTLRTSRSLGRWRHYAPRGTRVKIEDLIERQRTFRQACGEGLAFEDLKDEVVDFHLARDHACWAADASGLTITRTWLHAGQRPRSIVQNIPSWICSRG